MVDILAARFLDQFYQDLDQDSYGNPDSTIQTCFFDAPDGYVMNHDDCDDTNFDINPDAIEIIDSLDNDCNGFIDDIDSATNNVMANGRYRFLDGSGPRLCKVTLETPIMWK